MCHSISDDLAGDSFGSGFNGMKKKSGSGEDLRRAVKKGRLLKILEDNLTNEELADIILQRFS